VLIPKLANPEEFGQFRPIGLCNVLYKIACKVVANISKAILPHIISEEQSAFVLGCLIVYNIISAFECFAFYEAQESQKFAVLHAQARYEESL
jgi:hypothetical protein